MNINQIVRPEGIPGDLKIEGAYISNDQLVYIFSYGKTNKWYEYNFTLATWHIYEIVSNEKPKPNIQKPGHSPSIK